MLAVPPAEVKENWDRAINAYAEALGALVGSFGVAHPSLSPPAAMILAMAAFMDDDLDTTISAEAMTKWYWRSIRTQAYAQGANTLVVSDVDREGESGSEITPTSEDPAAPFLEPVRRNRILVNGIGSALALRMARDIHSGALLCAGGEGPIVARSIDSLARGEPRNEEGAVVASMVFGRESSMATIASAVRKGAALEDVCDAVALRSQHVDVFALGGDYKGRALELSSLLAEVATDET